eukprot:150811_1
MMSTIRVFLWVIFCLFSGVHATNMSTTYSVDATLTANQSPYYIYSQVTINNGATLTIENGVEIIFMNDVYLYIDDTGGIVVGSGCDSTNVTNTVRGLLDQTSHVHIHSDQYDRKGWIYFAVYRTFHGSFCNTKFNGLNRILVGALPSSLFEFNFCEFENMQYALKAGATERYADQYHTISNSYIHNVDYATSEGYCIFDNCLIESFTNTGGMTEQGSQIHFLNSHVIGTGNNTCFQHSLRAYVYYENSTIESCEYAIKMIGLASGPWEVRYTTIKDCDIGIYIGDDSSSVIRYNNFINNDINIRYYWRFTVPATKTEYYNYNYWGTANITQIATKIDDVCNKYSVGFVTWWPYYTQMIDIYTNALPNDEYTISDFGDINCNAESTANYLDFVYLSDKTLTADKSPYALINDVVINEGATLFIENGVGILFHEHFAIKVEGALDIGCYQLDTSASSQIGLASDISTSYSIISAGLAFDNNSVAQICNTLFNGMGLSHIQPTGNSAPDIRNAVTFDNCEFSSGYSITSYYDPFTTIYKDSYFHAFEYVNYAGQGIYDHCIFRDFTQSVYSITYEQVYPPSILNSYIYGNLSMNQTCVRVSPYDWVTAEARVKGIKNNVFTTCLVGIESNVANETIEGNTFDQCETAIAIYPGGNQTRIKHNNFMSCNVSIANAADNDQLECGYNYFDTTDVQQISDQIQDLCDGYSNGLVYWWPYLTTHYPSSDSSTIEYNGCASLLNGSVTIHAPTSDPTTHEPTSAPNTKTPTDTPTGSPTRNPVTNPPSSSPFTNSPTNAPLTETPTGSPTFNPVTNPPTDSPFVVVPSMAPFADTSTSSPTSYQGSNSPSSSPTNLPTTYSSSSPTRDATATPTAVSTTEASETLMDASIELSVADRYDKISGTAVLVALCLLYACL